MHGGDERKIQIDNMAFDAQINHSVTCIFSAVFPNTVNPVVITDVEPAMV
jgi:hypothetical protein